MTNVFVKLYKDRLSHAVPSIRRRYKRLFSLKHSETSDRDSLNDLLNANESFEMFWWQ